MNIVKTVLSVMISVAGVASLCAEDLYRARVNGGEWKRWPTLEAAAAHSFSVDDPSVTNAVIELLKDDTTTFSKELWFGFKVTKAKFPKRVCILRSSTERQAQCGQGVPALAGQSTAQCGQGVPALAGQSTGQCGQGVPALADKPRFTLKRTNPKARLLATLHPAGLELRFENIILDGGADRGVGPGEILSGDTGLEQSVVFGPGTVIRNVQVKDGEAILGSYGYLNRPSSVRFLPGVRVEKCTGAVVKAKRQAIALDIEGLTVADSTAGKEGFIVGRVNSEDGTSACGVRRLKDVSFVNCTLPADTFAVRHDGPQPLEVAGKNHGLSVGLGPKGAVAGDVKGVTVRQELIFSDLAALAKPNGWQTMTYETKGGIAGTMLFAPWSFKPHDKVEIPLKAKGRYRIFLASLGRRFTIAEAPDQLMVALKGEPAPVSMDVLCECWGAGWWPQIKEMEWKVADLNDDTLVLQHPKNCRTSLLWVRLEPTDEAPDAWAHPVHPFIATNDAYAPAETMDDLLAPIMRLKDSPVKTLFFCLSNGQCGMATKSEYLLSQAHKDSNVYENEYAERCAKSYAMLQREHPRLLDELTDFAHKIGLEFHVSFRTGCFLDFENFAAPQNRADVPEAAVGIARPENCCRLWDGTPVARFSYASEAVQEFFLKAYAEALDSKVDGLNLIWVRAVPTMLFEPAFTNRFVAKFGERMKGERDPRVNELRAEIMTDFHRKVRKIAGTRPVSIFVPGTAQICADAGLDVKRLAAEGLVDTVIYSHTTQDVDHGSTYDRAHVAAIKKALEGTKAKLYEFTWSVTPDNLATVHKEGLDGMLLWDCAQKPWNTWLMQRRLSDADGAQAKAWEKANPMAERNHLFKTFNGFDAARYPWHTAY